MKLDLYDSHDRLKHFTKKDSRQALDIGECCQNLIDQRPFGNYPFYIFAHARTDDDGVTKRLIWQPRLTKPTAQTNSMLFKAYPGTDQIKVIWMIPAREMWNQYKKGNVTQHDITAWSIQQFQHNKAELERKEPDDLEDWKIDDIYRQLSQEAKHKKTKDFVQNTQAKLDSLVVSSTSSESLASKDLREV